MALATALIPGLDEIVRGNDANRRADAARRIAELFFEGAGNFKPEHVEFFDIILVGLVPRDGGQATVLGIDPARDALAIRRRTCYLPGETGVRAYRQLLDAAWRDEMEQVSLAAFAKR